MPRGGGIRMTLSVRKNKLPSVINDMTTNAAVAVSESIMEAERIAKQLAPVRTGQLRGSIRGVVDGQKGVLYTDLYYAAYNEYGTRYMAARPFMTPAMERVRGSYHRRMKKIFKG